MIEETSLLKDSLSNNRKEDIQKSSGQMNQNLNQTKRQTRSSVKPIQNEETIGARLETNNANNSKRKDKNASDMQTEGSLYSLCQRVIIKKKQKGDALKAGSRALGTKRRRSRETSSCLSNNDSLLDLDLIRKSISPPHSLMSDKEEVVENLQLNNNSNESNSNVDDAANGNMETLAVSSNHQNTNEDNLNKEEAGHKLLRPKANGKCRHCSSIQSAKDHLNCTKCQDNHCFKCQRLSYAEAETKTAMETLNIKIDLNDSKSPKCQGDCTCLKYIQPNSIATNSKCNPEQKNEFPIGRRPFKVHKKHQSKEGKSEKKKKPKEKPRNKNIIRIDIDHINLLAENSIDLGSNEISPKGLNGINDSCWLQINGESETMPMNRNKDKCENYYSFKYTSELIKKTCILCLHQKFHPKELLRFKTYESFIMYMRYLYQTPQTLTCYNAGIFSVNKEQFISYYYRAFVKRNEPILFSKPKIMCKMCLMKIMNSQRSLTNLLKILKDVQPEDDEVKENERQKEKENHFIEIEEKPDKEKDILESKGGEQFSILSTKDNNELNNNVYQSSLNCIANSTVNKKEPPHITNPNIFPIQPLIQLPNPHQISSMYQNQLNSHLNTNIASYPLNPYFSRCNPLHFDPQPNIYSIRQNSLNSQMPISTQNPPSLSSYSQKPKQQTTYFNNSIILIFEQAINLITNSIFELHLLILKSNFELSYNPNPTLSYQLTSSQLNKTYAIICNFLSLLNNYKINMVAMETYINQLEKNIEFNCQSSEEIREIKGQFTIEHEANMQNCRKYEEVFQKAFTIFNKTNEFIQKQKIKAEKLNMIFLNRQYG